MNFVLASTKCPLVLIFSMSNTDDEKVPFTSISLTFCPYFTHISFSLWLIYFSFWQVYYKSERLFDRFYTVNDYNQCKTKLCMISSFVTLIIQLRFLRGSFIVSSSLYTLESCNALFIQLLNSVSYFTQLQCSLSATIWACIIFSSTTNMLKGIDRSLPLCTLLTIVCPGRRPLALFSAS